MGKNDVIERAYWLTARDLSGVSPKPPVSSPGLPAVLLAHSRAKHLINSSHATFDIVQVSALNSDKPCRWACTTCYNVAAKTLLRAAERSTVDLALQNLHLEFGEYMVDIRVFSGKYFPAIRIALQCREGHASLVACHMTKLIYIPNLGTPDHTNANQKPAYRFMRVFIRYPIARYLQALISSSKTKSSSSFSDGFSKHAPQHETSAYTNVQLCLRPHASVGLGIVRDLLKAPGLHSSQETE
jgi:hypothetical protein